MRLFLAIELPPTVKGALARLRTEIPGARWVAREQLHLTLAFLGDLDADAAQLLGEALTRLRQPAFALRFGGLGCFPDPRRPRVVWAGLDPDPRLLQLASRIRDTVLACGIPQEDRPFAAHITLARCKLPAGKEVAAFLQKYRQTDLPPFAVPEFILFESQLTPRGAIHTPRRRFPLA